MLLALPGPISCLGKIWIHYLQFAEGMWRSGGQGCGHGVRTEEWKPVGAEEALERKAWRGWVDMGRWKQQCARAAGLRWTWAPGVRDLDV